MRHIQNTAMLEAMLPVKKELKKQGVDKIEDVFYCVPEKGHLLVIKK